jgi:hypothetical protein
MSLSVGPLFVNGVAVPSFCILWQLHMMGGLQYEALMVIHNCWYQLVPLVMAPPYPMWRLSV